MYIADLHIHSKYSRATSAKCEPEHLDLWARKKEFPLWGQESNLVCNRGKAYNAGTVKLMTIHGSKGLEFSAVFLCSEGLYPSEKCGTGNRYGGRTPSLLCRYDPRQKRTLSTYLA